MKITLTREQIEEVALKAKQVIVPPNARSSSSEYERVGDKVYNSVIQNIVKVGEWKEEEK